MEAKDAKIDWQQKEIKTLRVKNWKMFYCMKALGWGQAGSNLHSLIQSYHWHALLLFASIASQTQQPQDGLLPSSICTPWFPVPVAQQVIMMMMMSLFSRSSACFSVYLRMHQNAPQKTKITIGGECPQILLESRLQGGHVL